MISFEPLWKTMEERNISQYKLIKDYHISSGQLDRLRKNSNINTFTINQLCNILQCDINDVIAYTPDDINN